MVKRNQSVYLTFSRIKRENQAVFQKQKCMNHKETIEHKRRGYCSVCFFMVKRDQSVYLTFSRIKRENQAGF